MTEAMLAAASQAALQAARVQKLWEKVRKARDISLKQSQRIVESEDRRARLEALLRTAEEFAEAVLDQDQLHDEENNAEDNDIDDDSKVHSHSASSGEAGDGEDNQEEPVSSSGGEEAEKEKSESRIKQNVQKSRKRARFRRESDVDSAAGGAHFPTTKESNLANGTASPLAAEKSSSSGSKKRRLLPESDAEGAESKEREASSEAAAPPGSSSSSSAAASKVDATNAKDSAEGSRERSHSASSASSSSSKRVTSGPSSGQDIVTTAGALPSFSTSKQRPPQLTPVPTLLLRGHLRHYQRIGMHWLVKLYDTGVNGILADEMGLGKTIQTIATLCHLAVEKGIWGPHLIVVPTIVLHNWAAELRRWAPGLKTLVYAGTPAERAAKRVGWSTEDAFHVCVVSYNTACADIAHIRRLQWEFLVLDEAHLIRNYKSQKWNALLPLVSQARLLLTGTPLQNDLMELWAFLHFLMPHIFVSHSDFKEWFNNPLVNFVEAAAASEEQKHGRLDAGFVTRRIGMAMAMDGGGGRAAGGMGRGENAYPSGNPLVDRLHRVLRPFILRRLKKDVEKELPVKVEHVVPCPLSRRQQFLYEEFMNRRSVQQLLQTGGAQQDKGAAAAGPLPRQSDYLGRMHILMQLRKVCNHPDMFEPRKPKLPLAMKEVIRFCVPQMVVFAAEAEAKSLALLRSTKRNRGSLRGRPGGSGRFGSILLQKGVDPGRGEEPVAKGRVVVNEYVGNRGGAWSCSSVQRRAAQFSSYNAKLLNRILSRAPAGDFAHRDRTPAQDRELFLDPWASRAHLKPAVLLGDRHHCSVRDPIDLLHDLSAFWLTRPPLHRKCWMREQGATVTEKLPVKFVYSDLCEKSEATSVSDLFELQHTTLVRRNAAAQCCEESDWMSEATVAACMIQDCGCAARSAISSGLALQRLGVRKDTDATGRLELADKKAAAAERGALDGKLRSTLDLAVRRLCNLGIKPAHHHHPTAGHTALDRRAAFYAADADFGVVPPFLEQLVSSCFVPKVIVPPGEFDPMVPGGVHSVPETLLFDGAEGDGFQIAPDTSSVYAGLQIRHRIFGPLLQEMHVRRYLPEAQVIQRRTMQKRAAQVELLFSDRLHPLRQQGPSMEARSCGKAMGPQLLVVTRGKVVASRKHVPPAKTSPLLPVEYRGLQIPNKRLPGTATTTLPAETVGAGATSASVTSEQLLAHKADHEKKDGSRPAAEQPVLSAAGANNRSKYTAEEQAVINSYCVFRIDSVHGGRTRAAVRPGATERYNLRDVLAAGSNTHSTGRKTNSTTSVEIADHIAKWALRDLQTEAASSAALLPVIACCSPLLHLPSPLRMPDPRSLVFDCGKLQVLGRLLLQCKQRGDRVLVFTQFAKMLDLLEQFVSASHYLYARLDGSTTGEARQKLVERFNEEESTFCLLASTRAGGIGLNLTGANVVIFYDSDWNPATDRQAMDRVHRIGQTRDVHVFRLLTSYTVEENIWRKQVVKRKLDDMVIDEGQFQHLAKRKKDPNAEEDELLELLTSADLLRSARGPPPGGGAGATRHLAGGFDPLVAGADFFAIEGTILHEHEGQDDDENGDELVEGEPEPDSAAGDDEVDVEASPWRPLDSGKIKSKQEKGPSVFATALACVEDAEDHEHGDGIAANPRTSGIPSAVNGLTNNTSPTQLSALSYWLLQQAGRVEEMMSLAKPARGPVAAKRKPKPPLQDPVGHRTRARTQRKASQ